jgi:protein-S-isoprenylcysteine O-methyltransferase
MPIVMWIGLIFLASEAGLAAFKRAKPGETRSVDRGSLRTLWMVIAASVFVAFVIPANAPSWTMHPAAAFAALGVTLFGCGLLLRWYAIVYLGRFFTVDVAIAADHRVIDTGPYRYIRHPSYSGALMAFAGMGFCLGNWGSLAAATVPPFVAFLFRIRVEETALGQALGEPYRDYRRRTKRLVPTLY